MLYSLSATFLKQVRTLPLEERKELLWKAQGILSHIAGYLKMKHSDIDELHAIYKLGKSHYVLAFDDYNRRSLEAFSNEPSFPEINAEHYEASLLELLHEEVPVDPECAEILRLAYFPNWFIQLIGRAPADLLKEVLTATEVSAFKEEILVQPEPKEVATETKKEEITLAKAENPQIRKGKNFHKKHDVDGEKFEKEILRQLAKVYELKKQRAKPPVKQALKHVRFAKTEIIVEYDNFEQCLDLLQKRTRRFGCRNQNDDWKILLALTVPESLERLLLRHYPDHVLYTDVPDKGNPRIVFIVKKRKATAAEDEGLKKVQAKGAVFSQEIPEGAYQNIDEEEYEESIEIQHRDSSIKYLDPKYQKSSYNEQKLKEIETTMEDFFELDDWDEETDEEPAPSPVAELLVLPEEPEETRPAKWHCFLCGKKKIYSGEPAETVQLQSGKIVYLCKKHRGKM